MKINDSDINQAQKLFYESLDFQNVGNFIIAKEKLSKALKLYPGRESIINNIAIIYFNLEDLFSLESLIKNQKITNGTLLNLISAYILYLKKHYKNCIEFCLKNLNINSNNFEQILDLLIKSYFKTKDIQNIFKFMRLSLRSNNFLEQKYYNIGLMLFHLGKPVPAIVYFDKAININKSSVYLNSKALALLKTKNFLEGLELLENRFLNYPENSILFKNIPPLDNLKDISNKKVVVWYEQGLGDTLNFARYVLLLKQYTKQITFIVQDPLINILKNLDNQIVIKRFEEAENEFFDYQIPLMSLIKKFDNSLELPFESTIQLKQNSKKIDLEPNSLHIAFAHSGNQNYARDHYRSIDISKFKNIFKLENIYFYKLNKSNISVLDTNFNQSLRDLSNLDIYEISILLSNFDLIISTDTVFAHLCGILNINCILLLSKNSDWRWFDDHKTTVWYKSIRILKQKKLDDWDAVIVLINRFLRLKSYTKKKMTEDRFH